MSHPVSEAFQTHQSIGYSIMHYSTLSKNLFALEMPSSCRSCVCKQPEARWGPINWTKTGSFSSEDQNHTKPLRSLCVAWSLELSQTSWFPQESWRKRRYTLYTWRTMKYETCLWICFTIFCRNASSFPWENSSLNLLTSTSKWMPSCDKWWSAPAQPRRSP